MVKISNISNYIPPKSLGEGLNRVKNALNCTDMITNKNGFRLYSTRNNGTVYMTIGELHKTPGIVPENTPFNYKDYDTYAGTVLRIKNSSNCGKAKAEPNQLMQLMRTRLYSDAVVDSYGRTHKPVFAITDFGIINSKDGKPVVKYGFGKLKGNNNTASYVKEIKSADVPKEYTGVKAPDGNIIYYLKDLIRNGKRTIEMKMFENGLNVPIL